MSYPKDPKSFKRWEKSKLTSLRKDRDAWDFYDVHIQITLATYDKHLTNTPGYMPLDWHKVKAMIWIETGADSQWWSTNPMQIGMYAADGGMADILETPNGALILPDEYKRTLNLTNVPHNGILNIEAGIGYLLKRLAHFGPIRVPPSAPFDSTQATSMTGRGPQMASSALTSAGQHRAHRAGSSTNHFLSISNKYRTGIVGWRTFDLHTIQQLYNTSKGDGNYFDKLQFAYDVIIDKRKISDPL